MIKNSKVNKSLEVGDLILIRIYSKAEKHHLIYPHQYRKALYRKAIIIKKYIDNSIINVDNIEDEKRILYDVFIFKEKISYKRVFHPTHIVKRISRDGVIK
jgi:hypothetical protein